MSEVKWIQIVTDVFDNRKIKQIEVMPEGDAVIVVWFKLLCLAGKINDKGYVYFSEEIPYTEQLLATEFNKPMSTIQLALKVFEQFRMIEIKDDIIKVSNWEKYQNIEGMERIKEGNRERKRRQREREKLALEDMSRVTSHDSHTDVTVQNKNKNKNKDKEENINTPLPPTGESGQKKTTRQKGEFVIPTVDEVQEYCDSRGNGISAEAFIDHYSARGWKYNGNLKMVDWKAAVRTWEQKRGFKYVKPQKKREEKPIDPNVGLEKRNIDDPMDEIRHPYEDGWRLNDDAYWIRI